MQRLGVRDPDVVSRVTEYVPQVVTFIEKLIANGFAYKGETSIFFDTEAYIAAGHDYPKLKPTNQSKKGAANVTSADEMQEGEGTLSKAKEGEKRSPNDFALWKFSKKGEPVYPSPFGDGRPGWHIECSVMATDILGDNMDIHSGGWDLKFPHHDNEIAQSEACSLQHQWVNYFMHCGHLHIKGLKMSKSLKNFITIRQALDELGVTPRTMRLLFLANSWHKPMNFSDQSLDEAKERERVLRSFFGSLAAVFRRDVWSMPQGATTLDRELIEKFRTTEEAVHAALCDNFDTPVALTALMDLVSHTNRYLSLTDKNTNPDAERPSVTLLQKVGRYITRIFKVFGVVEGTDAIGLDSSAAGESGEANSFNIVVDTLVEFRDNVRNTAKETNTIPSFIKLCDAVRDEKLIDAGVRLEDTPGGGPTVWKRDSPALLRKEKEEREEQLRSNNKKKLENQIGTRQKLVEKWSSYNYPPTEYFARQKAELLAQNKECKFASFDKETGLPAELTEADGSVTAVTDKDVKKYAKELAKYEKLYNEFVSKGGDAWLKEQTAELEEMQKELAQL
ncbi:tRNA synthetases class I (C) catalytic domain containing protein, putative [Angomonas deanei]|uniref:tRNA synthetases class I (C) catalytic domain containing protein, putative n=1 Tax=Angomonas deanei TaxID=59799 RepID=A0A7G2CMH0_9TRYP|nr:tRNA synthetases class I (C) catalytic domain containing protein, putative [Angomonas deanei]